MLRAPPIRPHHQSLNRHRLWPLLAFPKHLWRLLLLDFLLHCRSWRLGRVLSKWIQYQQEHWFLSVYQASILPPRCQWTETNGLGQPKKSRLVKIFSEWNLPRQEGRAWLATRTSCWHSPRCTVVEHTLSIYLGYRQGWVYPCKCVWCVS